MLLQQISSAVYISSLFILITVFVKSSLQINEGDRVPLKRYQELNYNDFKFTTNSKSSKRDTANIVDGPFFQTNRLQFTAFNRRFKLMLKKDTKLVADHFDIEIRYPTSKRPTEHIHDFFTQNYYTGIVEDVSGSYVVCYFEKLSDSSQPLVYAQISIKNEDENVVYFVEPINNSTNYNDEQPKYIVYRSEDIISDVISNGVFK